MDKILFFQQRQQNVHLKYAAALRGGKAAAMILDDAAAGVQADIGTFMCIPLRSDAAKPPPDGDGGPAAGRDQNLIFSVSQAFSSLMGRRTCSMESRSRMVTQWSAGVFSSPTVSKSTVMQNGVPISSSRR